ncbi:MAG: DUF4294 domain-containing protein [Paludibacter sp.]|jgi:Domain of unknown function (DUF4294)
MNYFYQHKSHFLAAVLTLLVNAVLIFLLLMNTGSNFLSSITKNDTDAELAIQFQLLEQLSLPPMPSLKSANIAVKSTQRSNYSKSEDKSQDLSKESEESALQPSNDSILLTEIKKAVEEIKIIIPEDTLTKQQVQTQTTNEVKKALMDNNKKAYSDAKFFYDNYRTIKNIRFLYPYVMKVRQVTTDLNNQLATMKDNQEKRKLIRKTEKELFSQFEKDVRKMSYSQGKLMLKLIARETNESAFGLIKTYKGGIPATFWYSVGLVFQEDLKAKYDSTGEDALLEKIVRKYKQGDIK